MRIAVVSNAYHPFIGGVETHVRHLCRALAEAGDSVEVLTQGAEPGRPRVEDADGIVVRRFPLTVSALNYRFSASLWTWLYRNAGRYDVVHAHSYHALAALGAALTTPGPFVFTPHYHGTGHSRLRSALHTVYRPLGRRLVDRATWVICVSEAERALLVRDFPAVAGRVVVVPNAVDAAPLHAARARMKAGSPPAAEAPHDPRRRRILAVGRLETYKNLDAVLRALALLPPDVRLTVVGVGPAGHKLQNLAAQLGIAGRVDFSGRLKAEALADRTVGADAAVSVSSREAFGLAVADAITAGLPVVASDIAAHREVVALAGPGAWSTLVDPSDRTALAGALAAAVEAPRRPVETTALPSWSGVAGHTRAVYVRALTASPAADCR